MYINIHRVQNTSLKNTDLFITFIFLITRKYTNGISGIQIETHISYMSIYLIDTKIFVYTPSMRGIRTRTINLSPTPRIRRHAYMDTNAYGRTICIRTAYYIIQYAIRYTSMCYIDINRRTLFATPLRACLFA